MRRVDVDEFASRTLSCVLSSRLRRPSLQAFASTCMNERKSDISRRISKCVLHHPKLLRLVSDTLGNVSLSGTQELQNAKAWRGGGSDLGTVFL